MRHSPAAILNRIGRRNAITRLSDSVNGPIEPAIKLEDRTGVELILTLGAGPLRSLQLALGPLSLQRSTTTVVL